MIYYLQGFVGWGGSGIVVIGMEGVVVVGTERRERREERDKINI